MAEEKEVEKIVARLEDSDLDQAEAFENYINDFKEALAKNPEQFSAEVSEIISNFRFGNFEVVQVKSQHKSLADVSEANFCVAFIKVYVKITHLIDLSIQETNFYIALQAILSIFLNYSDNDEMDRAKYFLFSLVHKSKIRVKVKNKSVEKVLISLESLNDLSYIDLIVLATHCFIEVAKNDGFLALVPTKMVKQYKNPEDVIRLIYNCDKKLFSEIFINILTEK